MAHSPAQPCLLPGVLVGRDPLRHGRAERPPCPDLVQKPAAAGSQPDYRRGLRQGDLRVHLRCTPAPRLRVFLEGHQQIYAQVLHGLFVCCRGEHILLFVQIMYIILTFICD